MPDFSVGDEVFVRITNDLTDTLVAHCKRWNIDQVSGTIRRIRMNGFIDVEFDQPYWHMASNNRQGWNQVYKQNLTLRPYDKNKMTNKLERFPMKGKAVEL